MKTAPKAPAAGPAASPPAAPAAARRDPYPTDLTGREWRLVEPLLPGAAVRGRPRENDLREIVNAMLFIKQVRCPWRFLPRDFPPWPTVYLYERRWSADGTWAAIRQILNRPEGPPPATGP